MKAKYYTPEVMKLLALEKSDQMYIKLQKESINITNIGNGEG